MKVYEYSKNASNGIRHAHICALSYIQFNVWYYDFEYNDKRVRTFSRIENATQFVTSLVDDSKHRFIELESVY